MNLRDAQLLPLLVHHILAFLSRRWINPRQSGVWGSSLPGKQRLLVRVRQAFHLCLSVPLHTYLSYIHEHGQRDNSHGLVPDDV
jgi:hypothetical protein